MSLKSLRSQLLVWLLAPLAVVAGLDALVAYRGGVTTATLVYDRLLLGSARTIAEQIDYTDGHFLLSVPPAAIEMLDAGNQDHVYYRIDAPDGLLLAGYGDLAGAPRGIGTESWLGFDATFRGQPIRVVAFAQPVLGSPSNVPLIIEVAQTLSGRDALARKIWLHAVREQFLMLLLVGCLLMLGLRGGLKPLIALRDRMRQREPLSLESIEVRSVPSELQPLIAAFNEYANRLMRHMQLHSRFIGDASHQLRTPLAVLNMQIAFALRQNDPAITREVLQAIRGSVQSNIRLINQLLAFTEADSDLSPPPNREWIPLCSILCTIIEEVASLAESRSIDLGFEADDLNVEVLASEHLIHMLASNLIDNALRYSQAKCVVTIRVSRGSEGDTVLQIIDNGPGIPEPERERVFERFYRLSGSGSEGCGLGLAIVREAASNCEAHVELTDSPHGGLTVSVRFPKKPRKSIDVAATRSAQLSAPYLRTEVVAT
jgi:two-component system sensor histidine kinase TctE